MSTRTNDTPTARTSIPINVISGRARERDQGGPTRKWSTLTFQEPRGLCNKVKNKVFEGWEVLLQDFKDAFPRIRNSELVLKGECQVVECGGVFVRRTSERDW